MMNRKAFRLLGFIMFLTMTGYGIVLPTLPFIADNLHLSSLQMSSLIMIWAIAQFIAAPFWGRLADKIGRKPVLIYGLFGFGVAFLILIFAHNYWQLLLARLIGAALSAGTQPAVFSMVADQTSKEFRSQSIAKIGAINGLGFLCGPALGGVFAPLGVTAPFIVASCLALITIPFTWLFIKEPEILKENENTTGKKEVPLTFLQSLAMVTKTGYWNLYTIILGLSIAASSFFALLGYFMIARFDASPGFVSLAFSTQAGISVVVQFFLLEKFYKYLDEETISRIGLIIVTVGYCLISFAPIVWVMIFGCLFTGFGQALVRPTTTSMLSKQNKMGQGITMGLQHSIDSLGRIVGPLWGGWVFALMVSGPFITSAIITALLLVITVMTARQQKAQIAKLYPKDTGSKHFNS